MSIWRIGLLILLFSLVPMKSYSASPSAQDQAIVKGLQRLSEQGEIWINKRGCVSCHQVPTLIWSHEAAGAAGISIKKNDLERWETWSTQVVNFVKPEQKADVEEISTMSSNIDTMTQMLLAIPSQPGAAWRIKFSERLVQEQQADGSWRACGQLPMQRRPELETAATTTLWTTLALMREGVAFDQDKAIRYCEQIVAPESTEFMAVRLLVANEIRNHDSVRYWKNLLKEHENDDGGWGWRVGEASDALGTGYALYALSEANEDEAVVAKGVDFLVKTQKADGGWEVPGTKKSAKGRSTPTADDWGSAWAVIGLSNLNR